ncbi:MAG: sulfotransferase family protein [Pseudomonadota bacterium]
MKAQNKVANPKVIGAGFGRTGTDSLREALNLLGFGPCHHMRALHEDDAHKADWRRMIAGEPANWDVLLGGYRSCVDWPSAHFWPELIEAFPNAKVILTWRSAESWWTSFEKTILQVLQNNTNTEENAPGSQLLPRHVFGGNPLTKSNCIAAYEANVAKVERDVPKDRLLIYEFGDGWDSLCDFLNVDVPDQPYPSSNSTHDFLAELKT